MAHTSGGPRNAPGVYIVGTLEKPPAKLLAAYWFFILVWFTMGGLCILSGLGHAWAEIGLARFAGVHPVIAIILGAVHFVIGVMMMLRRESAMTVVKGICNIFFWLSALNLLMVVPLILFAPLYGLVLLVAVGLQMSWYYAQMRVIEEIDNYGMF